MLPVLFLSNSWKASLAKENQVKLIFKKNLFDKLKTVTAIAIYKFPQKTDFKLSTLLYKISVLVHLVLVPTEICGCDTVIVTLLLTAHGPVGPLFGYDSKSIRNSHKNTNNIDFYH